MKPKKEDPITPDIRALIQKLSQNCVDPALFEEILTTLFLMADEHKDRGDYKLINKVLKELRKSFQLCPHLAFKENLTLKKAASKLKIIDEKEFDKLVNPKKMV